MKNFIFITLLCFLSLSLVGCNNSTYDNSVKEMEVNGVKMEYNQDVFDIIDKTEENPIKLALPIDEKPAYTIVVNGDIYKLFSFPKENLSVVDIKTNKVDSKYELSNREYKKVVKLLEK